MSEFKSENILSNEEIETICPGLRVDQKEQLRRCVYQYKYEFESWYHHVDPKDTLESKFVEINQKEVSALLVLTKLRYANSGTRQEHRNEIENAHKDLQKLEKKLDSAIVSFSNCAFVKLGTRSPKDVSVYDFDSQRIQELLSKNLKKLNVHKKSSSTLDCLNSALEAFVIATNEGLKVSSGREALEMFGKSNRVHEDLIKISEYDSSFLKYFPIKIVVREWLEEMPERCCYEFRGFANKKQLNALSQYFDFIYSPDLVENRDLYVSKIVEFFERIKDRIPFEAYCIDFFVTSDGSVKIIELNPFHSSCGPCMFSWRDDRELFLHGPLEVRIRTEFDIDSRGMMPQQWSRWIHNWHRRNVPWMNWFLSWFKLF